MVLELRGGVDGVSLSDSWDKGKGSSSGVTSRLGGGELRPVFERGEVSPRWRFVARWSSSDAVELQLIVDVERTRALDDGTPNCGMVSARMGTGARPEPRLVPRTDPAGLDRSVGGEGASDLTLRAGVADSGDLLSTTARRPFGPLRG